MALLARLTSMRFCIGECINLGPKDGFHQVEHVGRCFSAAAGSGGEQTASTSSVTEYDLVETDHSLVRIDGKARRLDARFVTGLGHHDIALCAVGLVLEAVMKNETSSEGFNVNNVKVPGALMAYKQVWMLWNVKSVEDVTPQSLAFLRLIRPAPDLLIFGSGKVACPPPRDTLLMLKELGVHMESLSTVRAAEYFNLLNQEERSVLAAILPEV